MRGLPKRGGEEEREHCRLSAVLPWLRRGSSLTVLPRLVERMGFEELISVDEASILDYATDEELVTSQFPDIRDLHVADPKREIRNRQTERRRCSHSEWGFVPNEILFAMIRAQAIDEIGLLNRNGHERGAPDGGAAQPCWSTLASMKSVQLRRCRAGPSGISLTCLRLQR